MKTILLLAFCLSLVANVHAGSITNGLVVHLTFDNTLSDASGHGNNGTYATNGLTTAPTGPVYVPGVIGQAFQFVTKQDGSEIDFVSLGYPSDLIFEHTNSWSISFWINVTSARHDPVMIGNRNNAYPFFVGPGMGITYQQGRARVELTDTTTDGSLSGLTNGTIDGIFTTNATGFGSWHNIVVTYAVGTNLNLYVDGVLQGSVADTLTTGIDTENLLNGLGLPYAWNIGQDGTGAYNDSGTNVPPPGVNGDVGVVGAIDDVGFWRRALTSNEVTSIFVYGNQGIDLQHAPELVGPYVSSFTPASGTVTGPGILTTATIVNHITTLDTNSVKLFVDGVLVSPTLTTNGNNTTTVTYQQPFLSAPLTQHTNEIIFANNSVPPIVTTNFTVYTISPWANLYLPTPIYYENFDELSVASNGPPTIYPTGWTANNQTDPDISGWNLFSDRSDTYLNWAIVPMNVAVSDLGYGAATLNVNGTIVVNDQPVTVLGSGNIAYAESGYRQTLNQIQYMYTGDYDLSGYTNIYVAFNSITRQWYNNINALEYSIDQGTNWLPVVYMIVNDPNYLIETNGVIDAYATFSTYHPDLAYCISYGGHYGDFIGDTNWSTLGPYIMPWPNNGQEHMVLKFRLPQADGQAHVRFRFAQAAEQAYIWAIDDFGIYSIPPQVPPRITSIVRSAGSGVTIHWNGTGANNASGLQRATSLNPPNWVDIPGTIGQTNYTETTSGGTAFYRVVRY